MFHDLKWSPSEKKIARTAFDAAQESALAKVMAEFKEKTAAATTPREMWEIEDFLHQKRREIEEMFDYRYSQLPLVFARLIQEGHLDESLLDGLSGEKRDIIRSFLALAALIGARLQREPAENHSPRQEFHFMVTARGADTRGVPVVLQFH